MRFLLYCSISVVILILQLGTRVSYSQQVPKKPHIVFILADDLGWNDVSFHGSPQIPTPNIDALAYSGLILQNYYATPICTPSRSALMTGKYPIHTGMQHDVIRQRTRYALPLEEVILPEHLKSLGYRTHMIGKWHLGHFSQFYTPNYRGFDSFYGYYSPYHGYYDHLVFNPLDSNWVGYDMRRNLELDWSAYGNYSTSLFSDEAEAIIQTHDPSRPLFLYLSQLASHAGSAPQALQAPPETEAIFSNIENRQRRTYAGMVYEMDKSVGQLVKALSDRQMLQDTIIIFSSDNGAAPERLENNAGSNWPLRGAKNTTWEGAVRVIGLVWSPLIPEDKRGKIVNGLIDITDWLPTLYEAAGGDLYDLGSIDGLSHWNEWLNDLPSSRTQLLHNIDDIYGISAVRKDNYKLVQGTTYDGSWDGWYGPSGRDNTTLQAKIDHTTYLNEILNSEVGKSLASLNMKLPTNLADIQNELEVNCGEQPIDAVPCLPLDGLPCLFDLSKDPCEYDNIADKFPELVEELLGLIQEYNQTSVTPLNADPSITDDPKADPKYWNCTVTYWTDLPFDDCVGGRNCPLPIIV